MIIKCPACLETIGEGDEIEAASLARSHAHHCTADESKWVRAITAIKFQDTINNLGG